MSRPVKGKLYIIKNKEKEMKFNVLCKRKYYLIILKKVPSYKNYISINKRLLD